MTISPSRTHRFGNCARNGSSNSGKYRFRDFWSRLCSRISSPSRNTSARKPSHVGSKIQDEPAGSCAIRFDSIGRNGGFTGSCTFLMLHDVVCCPRPGSPKKSLQMRGKCFVETYYVGFRLSMQEFRKAEMSGLRRWVVFPHIASFQIEVRKL